MIRSILVNINKHDLMQDVDTDIVEALWQQHRFFVISVIV